jgi:tetratricopeptide (TPR) repeat protein
MNHHHTQSICLKTCRTAIVLAGLFVCTLPGCGEQRSAEELVAETRTAMAAREYARAKDLALSVPETHDLWNDAVLLAGEAATRNDELEEAVRIYQQLDNPKVPQWGSAQFALANVCLHMGRLTEAENAYRAVLQHEPGNVSVHSRLSFLLGATGRRWETEPHLQAVLKSGSATIQELVLLADLERPSEEGEFLKKCRDQQPDEPLVLMGLAADAAHQGDADAAIAMLKDVLKQKPDLLAAHALLGELLVFDDPELFEAWHDQLPAQATQSPEIWYIKGLKAREQGNSEMAVHCFGQTLRLNPVHRRATYQLGRTLTELNDPHGPDFAERSRQLEEVARWLIHALRSGGRNEPVMKKIVGLMDQTGRVWETCGWALVASENFPASAWPSQYLQRLTPRLTPDLPTVDHKHNMAQLINLTAYPDFKLTRVTPSSSNSHQSDTDITADIHFQDEQNPGLNFTYYNAANLDHPGARMQEQTGGSVSVFDVDSDGWPDVYLTQGSIWKEGAEQPEPDAQWRDRIFRNQQGQHFADITDDIGLLETGFGQSCAVGDVNNDGFPDLYVANIGRNTLYINNSDGTFSVAATSAQSAETVSEWTSSSMIADVNGDGWSDIVNVNYVSGNDVYRRICSGRACSPGAFTGTIDEFLINDGAGYFRSVRPNTAIGDAKGLGVLAFSDAPGSLPQVFVANDQMPNFLLKWHTAEDGTESIEDSGQYSGAGYSQAGLLTATMGIAADDIDQNGLVDLFVTNFSGESNLLYLQTSPGLFRDTTRTAGLQEAGLPYVSWGTQFLDADLDGLSDLIVTSGHLDDFSDRGDAYRMPCQFFHNRGRTQFEILTAAQAGAFFDRTMLGRGLAVLDWNRDGLKDFAVAMMEENYVLVTNQSRNVGSFLNVRLHATTTSRDACFAQVTVSAGDQSWTRQLVAGDGYHAANERSLQFGLGAANRIDNITVSWPSGKTSCVSEVSANSTIDFVEGHTRGTLWQQTVPESIQVAADCSK